MKDTQKLNGIGCDIIEIYRISQAIERYGNRFLERIFTQSEIDYAFRFRHSDAILAGRFAAKEAISKALGTGIGEVAGWKDIEIIKDSLGKPVVQLSDHLNKRFKNPQILISISHSKDNAIATAIWYSAS